VKEQVIFTAVDLYMIDRVPASICYNDCPQQFLQHMSVGVLKHFGSPYRPLKSVH